MTSFRDPVGITCPVHGLQAGRTICKWCSFDPLSSRLSIPAEALPRTFTGVAVFSSKARDERVADPITDMAS